MIRLPLFKFDCKALLSLPFRPPLAESLQPAHALEAPGGPSHDPSLKDDIGEEERRQDEDEHRHKTFGEVLEGH